MALSGPKKIEPENSDQCAEQVAYLEQQLEDLKIALSEFSSILDMCRTELLAEASNRGLKLAKKATAQDVLRTIFETIFWK